MTPKEINWDAELAKVDKVMGAGGGANAPAPVPAPRGGSPAPAPKASQRAVVATWTRLILALVLGLAMTQWPYLHGCGIPLFLYLGAVVTVIVASMWSLISSWRTRSVRAHTISVILLFWGAALAAREVLPRIGYAKQASTWMCTQPAPSR
ncbi:MAG TPA: hypothetical protein VGI83_03220 [Gemmatimonadales bacterium]